MKSPVAVRLTTIWLTGDSSASNAVITMAMATTKLARMRITVPTNKTPTLT